MKTPFFRISILLAVLVISVGPILAAPGEPTPAAKRVDAVQKQLGAARSELEAAARRVEDLKRSLAEAERQAVRETVARARQGDEAALNEVLAALDTESVVVDYIWAGAVQREGADDRAVVKAIQRRWTTAGVRLRQKLCWLLGHTRSTEAGQFLRTVLDNEQNADVLGAALAALARQPRSPADTEAARAHIGDERMIETAIGYFPHSTVGELTGRLLAELEQTGQATTPGEVVVEPPTFHCLGLEWHINGDTNHNCAVRVQYRRKGRADWRQGFPFLRCENLAHPLYKVHPGNLLAGSLFDLEPDTEYEVRLSLTDPDGGTAERTLTARPRAVPEVYAGQRVLHVVPGDGGGSGTKDDPLLGIEATFAHARPGTVFLLGPGTYKGVTPVLKKSGEPGRPIVYRGVDLQKVVVDGKGELEHCFEFGEQKHIHLEHITFTRARFGVKANNTEYVVVRGCRFLDLRYALSLTGKEGRASRCAYIADNVILGGAEWPRGRRQSTYGLIISGEGHVICRNRIANHWDGITLSYAKGRGKPVTRSVDIYGNDIRQCVDDGIEADYVHHNVRIFRNRLVNTFSSLSFQPIYGGPGYLLYNAMYNTTNKPFKFHVHPSGMIVAHNTCLTSREAFYGGNFHNALFRNNLILGLPGEQGYWLSTQADRLGMDYSGYNVAAPGRPFAKLNNVRYADIATLTEDMGIERHSVEVGWDAFLRASPPPGQQVTVDPATLDLRLHEGSAAIDAGVVLPGLTGDFHGDSPDLGCYETGEPRPHYGPVDGGDG